MLILLVILAWILFVLFTLKSSQDTVKETASTLPSISGAFELVGKREYENSTYFSYRVNRRYKKLAQRLAIRGISRHKDEAEMFCYSKDKSLGLEREKDNPKDKNAIKIFGNGYELGYVPKEAVGLLAPIMDRGVPLYARVDGVWETNDGRTVGVEFSIWGEKDRL